MEILNNNNAEVLSYFQKFWDKEDFETHYKKLDELSRFRLLNEIKLDKVVIPNIGPSEELGNFWRTLEGWEESEKNEVKKLTHLYMGDEIESPEEAVFLIGILKKIDKPNSETLEMIEKDLREGNLQNLEKYTELLKNFTNTSQFFGTLIMYLCSILE